MVYEHSLDGLFLLPSRVTRSSLRIPLRGAPGAPPASGNPFFGGGPRRPRQGLGAPEVEGPHHRLQSQPLLLPYNIQTHHLRTRSSNIINNNNANREMLDIVRPLDTGNDKRKPSQDVPATFYPPPMRPLRPATKKNQDNPYKDMLLKSDDEPLAGGKRPARRFLDKSGLGYAGYVKLCLCGVTLMGIAFSVYFIDPVNAAKTIMLTMRDGSYIYEVWRAPPIKLYIKIFIFNITNAQEFMSGEHSKLKVQEIGPYTYSEKMENTNVTWHDNDTLSFNPTRKVVFERDFSVGDPSEDIITVANIPLLGIASMMHNSSVGMSLALSTLISYMNAQPLLTMPVDSFLWGYEDPLVKLARRTLPSWINFERFGLLDRMMDEGKYRVNMFLNPTENSEQFTMNTINGSPGLKNWGYVPGSNSTSKCNNIRGSTEGYLLPSNMQPNSSFTVFRRAFCRPLPFVYMGEEITKRGYRAFKYTFPENILDPENPDNKCYCKDGCLPYGLSDLSPCYYNIPVAISQPHFYKADPSLLDCVEGMSPDEEKHSTVYAVQPDAGVPLYVKTRVQTNLVVKTTKYIPRVKKFNDLTIPVLWMQVELLGLPKSVTILMDLLLIIGPALQHYSIALSAIVGLTVVFFANLRYAWRSGLFDSRRRATLIRFRQKQRSNSYRMVEMLRPKESSPAYTPLAMAPSSHLYISR